MQNAVQLSILDYEIIKARQRTAWSYGDYGRIGVRMQIVAELLCEAVDLRSTDHVVDVAAGNGNAALAAARRLAQVTATDYVRPLLEDALHRADADGLTLSIRVADAENLPFTDGEFDVALSTFGVMFTPNQERAAAELLRVVKPGGRIGLANWTPDGLVGELNRVVGRFTPAPAGVRSPVAWGTETRLVELFGPYASDIRTERKQFVFRDRSARHWIEAFRTYHGPTRMAFAALEAPAQEALTEGLLELLAKFNRGNAGALVAPAEYLEAVIDRA